VPGRNRSATRGAAGSEALSRARRAILAWYTFLVENKNLADPNFEPSDEQLLSLVRRAFAPVPEAEQRRKEKLREDIARERQIVLARIRSWAAVR
jgi:hypothetical protein